VKIARGLAFVLVAALACNRAAPATKSTAPPPPKKQATGPDDPNERANLLNFAHGATVISRTGEATLANSALGAIDGDLTSAWVINAGDYPQTATFALATRSRIDRIGIATGDRDPFTIANVEFESSLDGVAFKPLGKLTPKRIETPQLINVTPVEAKFIRATLVSGDRNGRATALFALGAELEPAKHVSIDGCWTINGMPATFGQHGAHAFGVIETTPTATHLDGGFDGRFFRFTWTRGASYGFAAISVSPAPVILSGAKDLNPRNLRPFAVAAAQGDVAAGRHLSGHHWHEEPIPLFFAESWFGERRDCATSIADHGEVTQALLKRSGRAPLYGLAFDTNGNLVESASVDTLGALRAFLLGNPGVQARLVAHEFHAATPEQNRAIANARLTTIEQSLLRNGVPKGRLSFVAAGSDDPREVPVTDAMRALYSSVDLEIRR
jgi:outer membrane protein OmpA-like peptidoglycan-associated protein